MATLWEKFPGSKKPENYVKVIPQFARFRAQLDHGRFLWDKETATFFKGNASEKYVLDGITLSASIDELSFSSAINPLVNGGSFSIDIISTGNGHSVIERPFHFAAFSAGLAYTAIWNPTATQNNEETFNINLTGSLVQTPELIRQGVTEIFVFACPNVYRIKENLYGSN